MKKALYFVCALCLVAMMACNNNAKNHKNHKHCDDEECSESYEEIEEVETEVPSEGSEDSIDGILSQAQHNVNVARGLVSEVKAGNVQAAQKLGDCMMEVAGQIGSLASRAAEMTPEQVRRMDKISNELEEISSQLQ